MKEESRFLEVFKDKLKHIFNENNYMQHNRFFEGIERVDYTKEEQIAKTVDLY